MLATQTSTGLRRRPPAAAAAAASMMVNTRSTPMDTPTHGTGAPLGENMPTRPS